MENKPLITFSGDRHLFSSLSSEIVEGLPQESLEWTRSYGRGTKTVYVAASFVPFSEDVLPKENDRGLLDRPFFHTYWTECNDVENYKQNVREDITTWVTQLKDRGIYEWLIIVLEHIDNKKGNKAKLLPRTTVLDKIKNDFPSKNSERCISLLDSCKTDARTEESWLLLLQRVRELLLQAYSKQLSQYEDYVRSQREKRNESGWNFQDFFFLQEELAFVYEMFGVYEEALVQYDELDALFTQFVINSNVGDMPDWLSHYSQSCNMWSGICLLRKIYGSLGEKLHKGEGCLLDLRNYLFSRQCALLLLLCRPWEVAQRTLPFLLNCVSELRILEVSMPPGSVACWVFLSCLEVLQTCERFSDSKQMEAYSLYTAGLWAYAREKLHELGILCGLMPDMEPSSEQLHLVVGLLSGMGEDPYTDGNAQSPHARLREALSSKESFLKHYLELSELTMGTFKHIGRIRTARLIGKDLAELYKKLSQPEKATGFLTDMLKKYNEENWELLSVQTQQELAVCYKSMKDFQKYLKTCARIAASPVLNTDDRKFHFSEVLDCSQKLNTNEPVLIGTEKLFTISDFHLETNDSDISCDSEVKINFNILSALPQEIICRYIRISLKFEMTRVFEKGKDSSRTSSPVPTRATSPSHTQSQQSASSSHEDSTAMIRPILVKYYGYKSDGTTSARVMCKNVHQVLRRRDSQRYTGEKEIVKDDYSLCISAKSVHLTPGKNKITVKKLIKEAGTYTLSQMCLEWGNINFILPHVNPRFTFSVVHKPPTIDLQPSAGELLAGLEQTIVLKVSTGKNSIVNGTLVHLQTSSGLQMKATATGEEWSTKISIPLPELTQFQTATIPFKVFAHFGPQINADTVERRIIMKWPWCTGGVIIPFHFLPPFLSANKLHTCANRKYVQIIMHGLTEEQFDLTDPVLKSTEETNAVLKSLNSPCKVVTIGSEQTACFLWELKPEKEVETIKLCLTLNYNIKNSDSKYLYSYDFSVNNYKTIYGIVGQVKPQKGSEFCKAGIVCQMNVTIIELNPSPCDSILYEVVADQSMWSVCGKMAGVVKLDESGKHKTILDVMPLIGGFLPLPTVRLSKYIPAEQTKPTSRVDANQQARSEPFDAGQVYCWSKATQVHVLPATTNVEVAA